MEKHPNSTRLEGQPQPNDKWKWISDYS